MVLAGGARRRPRPSRRRAARRRRMADPLPDLEPGHRAAGPPRAHAVGTQDAAGLGSGALSREFARGRARPAPQLAAQMRLVGVALLGCDAAPVRAVLGGFERPAETQDLLQG